MAQTRFALCALALLVLAFSSGRGVHARLSSTIGHTTVRHAVAHSSKPAGSADANDHRALHAAFVQPHQLLAREQARTGADARNGGSHSGDADADADALARAHGLHFNPRAHALDHLHAHGVAFEVVTPTRTGPHHLYAMTTNARGTRVHPDRYQFKFTAYGKDFHIDVDKNTELLHPEYKACHTAGARWHLGIARTSPDTLSPRCRLQQDVVVHGDTMEVLEVRDVHDIEHCYFMGQVVGDETSSVTLSTCNGLRGSIRAHGEVLSIEPHTPEYRAMPFGAALEPFVDHTDQHMVYRQADYKGAEGMHCGGVSTTGTLDLHSVDEPREGINHKRQGTAADDAHARAHQRGEPDADANSGSSGTTSTKPHFTTPGDLRAPTVTKTFTVQGNETSFEARGPAGRKLLAACTGQPIKYTEAHVANSYARLSSYGLNAVQADTLSIVNTLAGDVYTNTQFTSGCISLALRGQISFQYSDAGAVTLRRCNTPSPSRPACTGCWINSVPQDCSAPLSTLATEYDVDLLLSSFRTWALSTRKTAIETIFASKLDNIHFFHQYDSASSVIGLATLAAVCTSFSAGVEQLTFAAATRGSVYTHELGHNWNMQHDASGAAFVMAPAVASPPNTEFSPASIAAASSYMTSLTGNANCLTNSFTSWTNPAPFCGNGVQEPGEQCDAGGLLDTCCTATCTYAQGCVCANTQPCCTNGQYTTAGTVCRAGTDATCDTGETCTGVWGLCPIDTVADTGTSCTDPGNGASCASAQPSICHAGACVRSRTNACRTTNNCQYGTSTGTASSTDCSRLACSFGSWLFAPDNGTPCGGGTTAATQNAAVCISGTCTAVTPVKSLTVSEPVSGATLITGNSYSITWTGAGMSGANTMNVYAQYQGVSTLIASARPQSGTFSWMATGGPAGAGWRIRVEDGGDVLNFAHSGAWTLQQGAVNNCATNNGGCDALVTCASNTCGACPSGYNGNGQTVGSCIDINECATTNGGCFAGVTCTNTPGSRTCGACPSGYTGNGITCTDVNECATNNGGCSTSPAVTCSNTQGSRSCATCPSGYTGNGVGNCVEINECATNNGGCSTSPAVACTNTVGSRTCSACPSGYTGSGVGNCVDVNECATNNGGCSTSPAVTCTNTGGSRTCGSCPSGYTGNGVTCTNVNECATNNGGCSTSPAVTCTDTPGSRTCGACPSGYSGNGQTCTEINECATNNGGCSSVVTCTNTPGSRTCGSCPAGYTGNGLTCTDVNECATNNGGCSTSPRVACTNTGGSRSCGACPSGYSGSGVGTCVDINECALNNGGCITGVSCTNSAGSYSCGNCPAGYVVSGTACVDINECATLNGGCSTSPFVTCTNTPGAFSCGTCPTGYTGPGTNCVDVDECADGNNGGCDPLTTCTNQPGARTCSACPAGYDGTGASGCVDRNECATNNGGCDARTACTNTPAGSYTCAACPAGFTSPSGDGTTACVPTGSNDPCASVACANGGSCAQGVCTCREGYSGATCAVPPTLSAVALAGVSPGVKQVTWASTGASSSASVTIKLYRANDAVPVAFVAERAPNTHSFVWSIPASVRIPSHPTYRVTVSLADDPVVRATSPDFAIADGCAFAPCQNGGACDATTAACTCAVGFAGVACETSFCSGVVCSNGGVCSAALSTSAGVGTCVCPAGYTGRLCEAAPTCSVTCAHGGTVNGGCTSCTCPADTPATDDGDWSGATCSECAYTCQNGGTANSECNDCVCPAGYGGARCGNVVLCLLLRLARSYASLGAAPHTAFNAAFRNDVATALRVQPSQVVDVSARADPDAPSSHVLVRFCLATDTGSGGLLGTMETQLTTQVGDTASRLYRGDTTAAADSTYGVQRAPAVDADDGSGGGGGGGNTMVIAIAVVVVVLALLALGGLLYWMRRNERGCFAAKSAGMMMAGGDASSAKTFTTGTGASSSSPKGLELTPVGAPSPAASPYASQFGRPKPIDDDVRVPVSSATAVGAAVAPGGASDWTEQYADGKKYYWNSKTGESSWTRPADMGAPAAVAGAAAAASKRPLPTPKPKPAAATAAVDAGDWSEQYADGKKYYWNSKTGESSWTRPAAMGPDATAVAAAVEDVQVVVTKPPPKPATKPKPKPAAAPAVPAAKKVPPPAPARSATKSPPPAPAARSKPALPAPKAASAAASGASSSSVSDWSEQTDDQGRTYYWNAKSGESKWSRPAAMGAPPPPVPAPAKAAPAAPGRRPPPPAPGRRRP